MKKNNSGLKLVFSDRINLPSTSDDSSQLTTIDLFSGAGGITEGFRQARYQCLYANDCMPEAIKTFAFNHPQTWADCCSVEDVKPAEIRSELKIRKGELDVLVGDRPARGSPSMRRIVS